MGVGGCLYFVTLKRAQLIAVNCGAVGAPHSSPLAAPHIKAIGCTEPSVGGGGGLNSLSNK